jgi:hypothetical protein
MLTITQRSDLISSRNVQVSHGDLQIETKSQRQCIGFRVALADKHDRIDGRQHLMPEIQHGGRKTGKLKAQQHDEIIEIFQRLGIGFRVGSSR